MAYEDEPEPEYEPEYVSLTRASFTSATTAQRGAWTFTRFGGVGVDGLVLGLGLVRVSL
jgi:hypothetical protein